MDAFESEKENLTRRARPQALVLPQMRDSKALIREMMLEALSPRNANSPDEKKPAQIAPEQSLKALVDQMSKKTRREPERMSTHDEALGIASRAMGELHEFNAFISRMSVCSSTQRSSTVDSIRASVSPVLTTKNALAEIRAQNSVQPYHPKLDVFRTPDAKTQTFLKHQRESDPSFEQVSHPTELETETPANSSRESLQVAQPRPAARSQRAAKTTATAPLLKTFLLQKALLSATTIVIMIVIFLAWPSSEGGAFKLTPI